MGGESTRFHGLIISLFILGNFLNKRRRPTERLPRPHWLGALRWTWGQRVHLDTLLLCLSISRERLMLFNLPLKRIFSLKVSVCFSYFATFNLRQDTAPFLGLVGQLQRKRNLLFLRSRVDTDHILLKILRAHDRLQEAFQPIHTSRRERRSSHAQSQQTNQQGQGQRGEMLHRSSRGNRLGWPLVEPVSGVHWIGPQGRPTGGPNSTGGSCRWSRIMALRAPTPEATISDWPHPFLKAHRTPSTSTVPECQAA